MIRKGTTGGHHLFPLDLYPFDIEACASRTCDDQDHVAYGKQFAFGRCHVTSFGRIRYGIR
jgi:hypothetical protein